MKNAMQLKAIIKNIAEEKHVTAEFYLKRQVFDCCNGGA